MEYILGYFYSSLIPLIGSVNTYAHTSPWRDISNSRYLLLSKTIFRITLSFFVPKGIFRLDKPIFINKDQWKYCQSDLE